MNCLIGDISKSESKLVTSQNIKCEKTSKPIKKTLIIRSLQKPAKNILKQKAKLMRYKISTKLPAPEMAECQDFNDITNNSTNVVISHIENFVLRKNRKEFNKKLINKLLRIRHKKSRTDYRPSFLDMPSLWTD
jgi:hypothetical protein